ncbi:unnamed protein product [Macrosiphum euphorbiae]|uniref:HAT C-terminal dimerisation domain-containing protein n=1 Tax=Macrosiphum euphorbiae TaxID=13131 RepID=A0AAV0XZ82_9HEMI|nr:unnamed protein product [Macrosiphum euphorbiae]
MHKKNRSGVWDYMDKNPNTPDQIQLLEANKLATQVEEVDDINVSNEPSTSTNSTAVTHYEHSTVQIEGPPPKRQKQLTLMNRFSLPPDSKVDQFNKAVVEMIAEDMQPLSIVENSGFRKLVNLLDSRYKLPSQKLIGTTLIPNLYDSTRKMIETILSHTKYVSLTSDIWTSLNTISFITVTVHFFDNNLNLKTYVLTTRKLESNHTAQYLSGVLTDIIREWKINTKVVAIVTDSGANIKAAIKLLGIDHIPCAAHKLNNAVKNALKSEFEENDIDTNHTEEVDMMKLVKMCRSIVGHFKHSEVSTRILHEKQKQLNSPVLKLKQDIAIRWNSTLTMMERLLLVKEPLMLVSMSLPRCPNMPSNEQWQTINDFVLLLKPFESLTIQLSSEQRPTLSKVIPLLRGLLLSVNNKVPVTLTGNFLKKKLLEQTTKRFDDIEEMYPSQFYAKATLLDPRFKKAAFTSNDNANDAEQEVQKEIADCIETNAPERTVLEPSVTQTTLTPEQLEHSSHSKEQENLLTYLETTVTTLRSQTTYTSTAMTLFKQYMNLEFLNIYDDPILFWKNSRQMLGALCDVALKYSCIPATSVPSERVFSKAGQIVSARRNRLLPDNVDKLIFLNANLEK